MKGERGVDRRISAAEMENVGEEDRKRERSEGKTSGCEKHPHGAEAEHGQNEEGEDEGDTHLVDERPECGVELRPVVVAQEEDVLKDKAGGYGRRPGPVDPVVVREVRCGEVEIAKDGEDQCAEIREIDAADSLEQKGAVAGASRLFAGESEDKPAEEKEENDGLMARDEEP